MTILETNDLTKRFGQLTAVDSVDLHVSRNEIHSVIGPNGAGKSTLFNLITGLLDPTAGRVVFNDEDITGLPPNEIARQGISKSFQITDVFDGLTVKENVQIAAQALDERRESMWRPADSLSETIERTNAILEDVDLVDHADTRADALSHGDRRKLELALATAIEPELLLLDEPTAGMGKEEANATMKMVREVAAERGITPVLVEHNLEIVMDISDTITVLNEGSVIVSGTPSVIRENERVQEAYLGTEVET